MLNDKSLSPETAYEATAVKDFDANMHKLARESFDQGVDFITKALIDTFRGMAFRDGAMPRVYTAVDVVKALKAIHFDVKRGRGQAAILEP